jgi:hypothetical protein
MLKIFTLDCVRIALYSDDVLYYKFCSLPIKRTVQKSTTPWSRVLQSPAVNQLIKTATSFIRSESSLPCWQQPITSHHLKKDESNHHPNTRFL